MAELKQSWIDIDKELTRKPVPGVTLDWQASPEANSNGHWLVVRGDDMAITFDGATEAMNFAALTHLVWAMEAVGWKFERAVMDADGVQWLGCPPKQDRTPGTPSQNILIRSKDHDGNEAKTLAACLLGALRARA